MATQAQLAAVQQLYVGYLGRAADSAGQQFWANAIANGTATIASVATGFTLSNEYKATYGGLSTSDLVEQVYNNVLSRAPDAAGKAFWVAALANGTVKADTLVATIVTNLGALDQQTINNKVFVAQTYTDTVGDQYSPAGGASVLVGVTNDPATVTKAIDAINSGAVPGQVPGQALINAETSANAAVVAYETSTKAAADALVAKLAATKTLAGVDQTTATDGIDATASKFSDKVTALVTDAKNFRDAITTAPGGDADTTVLVTRAGTADTALTTAFNALTVTQKGQANTYKAAIATEATAKAAQATVIEKAGVVASLAADASAVAGFTAHNGGTAPADLAAASAALYTAYVNGTVAQRTAIDTEFKDSSFYASFKTSAVKDAAYADAVKATATAKDVLDTTTGTVKGSVAGDTYIAALKAKTDADNLVTAAKAADADKAAVKAIADAYDALNTTAGNASQAITDFNIKNVGVSKVTDLGASTTGTAPVKDTFYFADKTATVEKGADYTIGSFAAGDSIVLGNGYAFNKGALADSNNNALEFFLVKTDTGTQVVIESKVFGGASVTADAHTGVASVPNDAVTVINLTGVTTDHVAVNNGVISYV
ncbi:DUF4214 domain-containing protein [Pseudomonas fluorescens]|uniref:DUF4214 domain-containing protein n=1 Tax=Pseudomonas fluorescens TaxID=294 RepID=UPI000D02481D|nr:DUF4214 domain-containing protein [Pseudomonas fluorescens]PRW72292.1 hypothetical protein C7A13_27650 [Pseudomonas fluorescens]